MTNLAIDTAATEEEADLLVVAMHLGDSMYGLDVAQIHTVITMQAITPVPKAPPAVKGVINLRGRIVPVFDLRTRFGLPARSDTARRGERIVIVDTQGLNAGLIVDSVSEVLRLPKSAIAPPSQLVSSSETECVTGIGRISGTAAGAEKPSDRLILLLDIVQILTLGAPEFSALAGLAAAA